MTRSTFLITSFVTSSRARDAVPGALRALDGLISFSPLQDVVLSCAAIALTTEGIRPLSDNAGIILQPGNSLENPFQCSENEPTC